MTRVHFFRSDSYGFCRRCGHPYSVRRHIKWPGVASFVRLLGYRP